MPTVRDRFFVIPKEQVSRLLKLPFKYYPPSETIYTPNSLTSQPSDRVGDGITMVITDYPLTQMVVTSNGKENEGNDIMAGMDSSVDTNILLAINHYDCLTIEQVQRIFSYKSYERTLQRLKRLADSQVLERKPLLYEGRGGSTWVYKVGRQGYKELRELGVSFPRFTMGAKEYLGVHWWHTIYVNDFFITAHRFTQQQPHIKIQMEMHELDLKRDRRLSKKEVIPDGWIDIHDLQDRARYCFCIELERNSRMPAAIREKIEGVVKFAQNDYDELFDTDIKTFLFFARDTEHRNELLKNMAMVLRGMGLEELAVAFKVTATSPQDVAIFTDATWFQPGIYTSMKLFD